MVDPIDSLTRISTTVTARVLRSIADALDPPPPRPDITVHIGNVDQLAAALHRPGRVALWRNQLRGDIDSGR